ncbi:ribosome-associated translation inhibitor RaiA [bacterium]|nr:ribosome-associated translation inhibitor RaiA [bacterium]
MNVNYTARNTDITPEIKKYCERRLRSIEKILGYPVKVDVVVTVEKSRYIVEINLQIKGGTLNSVEETHKLSDSLSAAFDHLERRVKKEKEKLVERKRRSSKKRESFPPSSRAQEEERFQEKIVRSQSFSAKPMSVEEALLQFEATKEEAFMFRKLNSEKWGVLYKKKNGNYGLIEPE